MERTAIVQARVRPEIKFAAERILRGLGLTMTELMELSLRHLIIDRKIPFEIVAMDENIQRRIAAEWGREERRRRLEQ